MLSHRLLLEIARWMCCKGTREHTTIDHKMKCVLCAPTRHTTYWLVSAYLCVLAHEFVCDWGDVAEESENEAFLHAVTCPAQIQTAVRDPVASQQCSMTQRLTVCTDSHTHICILILFQSSAFMPEVGRRKRKRARHYENLKKKNREAKKGRWQMKKIKDQRRQKHQINRKREAHRFQRGSIVWSVLQWCCGAGGVAEYFLETRSLFLPLSLSDPVFSFFLFLSKPSSNHIFLGWGKAEKWDQALFDCGRTHIQIRTPVDIWIAAMSNMTANGWSTFRGESSWGMSNMYSSAPLSSSSPC